jgi:hypothetical protein
MSSIQDGSCDSKKSSTTITVNAGEVCTIETAKLYNIFDTTKYFSESKISNSQEIATYNKTEFKPYSLCHFENNIAYTNCAIQTSNKWKTLVKGNTFADDACILPLDIKLPNHFESMGITLTSAQLKMTSNFYAFKDVKDFCQEKWYDWFSIPDYYHDNKYALNDNNCKAPCPISFIPNPNNLNTCILKKDIPLSFSLYAPEFHYTPIQLIMLLGSTNESLYKYHQKNLNDSCNIILNDKTLMAERALIDDIKSKKTFDNIYNSLIKPELRSRIKTLLELPFDESTIIPPKYYTQALTDKVKELINIDIIKDTYDIALNFSNMILSFNNGKIDEWNKQITNLIDISGVQKEDKLYWKQLNIFKRACSVAFDNNSSYSKKLLGDSLQPLNFSISVDDKLKSLPSTNRECPKCTEAELKILKNYDSKSIQEKQTSALEQEKRRSLMNGKENDIDLNKPELTDDEYDTECNKVYDDETDIIDKSMDKMKLFIQLWIFIILSLMFGFVIYVILSLFWDKIAYIFNSIVLRSTQFIYYLVNSFNKYFKKITDKEEEKEQYQKYFLTKIQRDNVTAKLDADMRRYNIKANNG